MIAPQKQRLISAAALAVCAVLFMSSHAAAQVPGGPELENEAQAAPDVVQRGEQKPDAEDLLPETRDDESFGDGGEMNSPGDPADVPGDAGMPPSAGFHVSEVWFPEVRDGGTEAAPRISPGEDVLRARVAPFDVNEALAKLIDLDSLLGDGAVAEDRRGSRLALPSDVVITMHAFDGKIVEMSLTEIGVSFGVDGTPPTIEVLGEVDSGASLGGSATFAFVAEEEAYELVGIIEDTDSGSLRVGPLSSGQYLVEETASATLSGPSMRAVDDTIIAPPVGEFEPLEEKESCGGELCPAVGNAAMTVSLLVGMANNTGPISAAKKEMAGWVAQTNAALLQSRMQARIQLLDVVAVGYRQVMNDLMTADIENLGAGVGPLKTLHTQRDSIGADLVALVVPEAAVDAATGGWVCGLGYVGLKSGTPDNVFSVNAKPCLNDYTLQHEIGHNLGSAHDPESSDAVLRSIVPPYAYGHRVPGMARDIMAYYCEPSDCAQRNQFANPNVPFLRTPSIPSGTPARNAARAIDEVARVAAQYRITRVAFDVSETHKFCSRDHVARKPPNHHRVRRRHLPPECHPESGSYGRVLVSNGGKASIHATCAKPGPFTDVAPNFEFYKEITWMRARGITTGRADGTFGPKTSVTRDAMAAFLYRFAGAPTSLAPDSEPLQ